MSSSFCRCPFAAGGQLEPDRERTSLGIIKPGAGTKSEWDRNLWGRSRGYFLLPPGNGVACLHYTSFVRASAEYLETSLSYVMKPDPPGGTRRGTLSSGIMSIAHRYERHAPSHSWSGASCSTCGAARSSRLLNRFASPRTGEAPLKRRRVVSHQEGRNLPAIHPVSPPRPRRPPTAPPSAFLGRWAHKTR